MHVARSSAPGESSSLRVIRARACTHARYAIRARARELLRICPGAADCRYISDSAAKSSYFPTVHAKCGPATHRDTLTHFDSRRQYELRRFPLQKV